MFRSFIVGMLVSIVLTSLTALSDEEVTMKEQRGFMYYFKVEVAEAPGTGMR